MVTDQENRTIDMRRIDERPEQERSQEEFVGQLCACVDEHDQMEVFERQQQQIKQLQEHAATKVCPSNFSAVPLLYLPSW